MRRPLDRNNRLISTYLLILLFAATGVVVYFVGPSGLRPIVNPSGAPGSAPSDLSRPTPGADLLLVTIDTLRADALGFAGNPEAQTPVLDRLAASGRVFASAHAHNVVTLPSHANILTGLHPYQHGVRDNAGFVLPGEVPTLATILRAAGYTTAAVVGAFPLDARFGLGRGFDYYDDRLAKAEADQVFRFAERPGSEVVARGLDWWRQNAGQRRFLWVHLFEPHSPYAPPEPFAGRFRERPYLGEVAAADAFLSPLLEPLLEGGEPPAFVLFTSDHGEGLGDHGELTHGIFAYEATLKVPLVVWGPGIEPGIDRRPAGHVDLLPTALQLLGLEPPPGLPGRPLLDVPPDPARHETYFEALTGNLARGWAPLRGVIRRDQKLVQLPLPELYDLADDPRELRNRIEERRQTARELRALLPEESIWPPERGVVAAEVEAGLRSLGYLGGGAPSRAALGPEDDPKNLIELDRKLHRMNRLYEARNLEAAVLLGREILQQRPDMHLASSYLSQILVELGRPREAVEVLEGALRQGGVTDSLLRQLAMDLVLVGRAPRAVELLQPLSGRGEPATLNVLGIALVEAGRAGEAVTVLERVFEADDTNARACENLSVAAIALGRWEDARSWAERALALEPRLPNAWNNLGVALSQLGRREDALGAWDRSLALNPRQLDTLFNLGVAAAELGRAEQASGALSRFLAAAPPQRYAAEIELARHLLRELS